MIPSRPYLLRGLYEWIIDNGLTPQIVLDGSHPDLRFPDSARTSDKIVFNVSPQAVRDLEIDNEYLSCVARFSGVSHAVLVPVAGILAIYARENGHGMMFPEGELGKQTQAVDAEDRKARKKSRPEDSKINKKRTVSGRRPTLKVIK